MGNFLILGILISVVIMIIGLIIYFVHRKQKLILDDKSSGDVEFNLMQNNDLASFEDNSPFEITIPVEILPENTLKEESSMR